MSKLLVISVCCLLLTSYVACSPIWLDQLFGKPGRTPEAYPQSAKDSQPAGQRRYRQICKVLSGDNYAFRGRVPYPSAPFCPYYYY